MMLATMVVMKGSGFEPGLRYKRRATTVGIMLVTC